MNRRNYNSIVFLTVYLGLVLVGATPQVLAHAATNSMFDLRNEIEYTDEFDNKPEDAALEALADIFAFDTGTQISDQSLAISPFSLVGKFSEFGPLADVDSAEQGFANVDLSRHPRYFALETGFVFNRPERRKVDAVSLPIIVFSVPDIQNNPAFEISALPRSSIEAVS